MGKSKLERERDRIMRALLLIHLLNCNKHGLTVESMASHCNVSVRTIYRDLIGLEAFGVKTYKDDDRYLLVPGKVLPPIMFTQPEAMAIFMATRLLLQQSSVYNHDIETAFTKLGSVVPASLRDHIMKTLEWMQRRRVDDTAVKKLNIVSQCWTERKQVRMRYLPLNASTAETRVIEPYFIQPSALARAVYIIANCRLRNGLRIFRLDRIIEAVALDNSYEIPESFDANEYLSGYWSITATGTPRTVKLRFRPEIARIATETVWHDTQATEAEMDGSVTVSMRLAITHDLVSFVLGWADKVEVLEPAALQRDVSKAARKIYEMYRREEPPPTQPPASGAEYEPAASPPAIQMELFRSHPTPLE
jgi:predicted DNA-binding transcriptional regulator YafY